MCPFCSQNAHAQKVLVQCAVKGSLATPLKGGRESWKAFAQCAQWKINQPPFLKRSRASLEGEWRGSWHGLCARRAPTMKRWSLDARNGGPSRAPSREGGITVALLLGGRTGEGFG